MKEGKLPQSTKNANKRSAIMKFEEPPFLPTTNRSKYDLFVPLDFEALSEFLKDFEIINDATLTQYFKEKSRSYIQKIREDISGHDWDPYQKIRIILTFRDTFDLQLNDLRALYKKYSRAKDVHASFNWAAFVQRHDLSHKAQFCNDEFYKKFRHMQDQNFVTVKRYLLSYAWKTYKLRNTDVKLLDRDQSQIEIQDEAIKRLLNKDDTLEKVASGKKPDARTLAFKTFFLQKAGDLEYFDNMKDGKLKKNAIEYANDILHIGGDNFYNIYNSLKGNFKGNADQVAIKAAIELLSNYPKALQLARRALLDNA